jgi:hypothetical protein
VAALHAALRQSADHLQSARGALEGANAHISQQARPAPLPRRACCPGSDPNAPTTPQHAGCSVAPPQQAGATGSVTPLSLHLCRYTFVTAVATRQDAEIERLDARLAAASGAARAAQRQLGEVAGAAREAAAAAKDAAEAAAAQALPRPESLNFRRRRVLHPVLIGHAVSLTPY